MLASVFVPVPSYPSLRVALALGVVVALGACGGSSDPATPPASASAPATTPVVAPAPAPAPAPAAGETRQRGPVAANVTVRFAVTAVPAPGDTPPQSTVEVVLTGDDGQIVRATVAEVASECVVQDTPQGSDVLTTRCWWAGAGHSIHAIREGDELVVRRLAIFEEAAENMADAVETQRFTLSPGATVRAVVTP